MKYLREVQTEYLELSSNQYGVPISLGDFKFKNWDEFVDCDIKFKVEFLTFPSWAGKFEYVKIRKDIYTHIKLKTNLID